MNTLATIAARAPAPEPSGQVPKDAAHSKDALFVTDTELIRRIGVPEKVARDTLRQLDADPRSGFPTKQKLWGGRRYWPAVLAYLEHTSGLKLGASPTFEVRRHDR